MAAALLAISRAVPRACKPAAQSASSFLRGSQSGTCVHKRMAGSFAQSFQSGWPDREIQDFKVPKRTVPEDKLRFQVRATFNSGSTAMLYGHLPGHPADFKVHLYVRMLAATLIALMHSLACVVTCSSLSLLWRGNHRSM